MKSKKIISVMIKSSKIFWSGMRRLELINGAELFTYVGGNGSRLKCVATK